MKLILLSLVFISMTAVGLNADVSMKVHYVQLKEGVDISGKPIKQIAGESKKDSGLVTRIYPDLVFQTMQGVGGAFNEIGGEAFSKLTDDQKNELMSNLFGIKGAQFSLCRTAVGSSDFGFDAYSYSEVANDYKMENFSIAREKKSVIPYIQAAYKHNPKMVLFASPWSPPGWMKLSGVMDRGTENPEKNRLKDDPKIYKAYALYFSKYVQAYAKEGITVNKLMIQNEQDCISKYPSCNIPPKQMAHFIMKYLRPQFKRDQIKTEIWAGTFRTAQQLDLLEFVSNKKWRQSVAGIGIQYTWPPQIMEAKLIFPSAKIQHTEGRCRDGKNSIKQGFERFEELASYINHGIPNYCYWNMILNETKESGWGWKQNSLINIDRKNKKIIYNPDYAAIYLFSKFIRPGFKRIGSVFTYYWDEPLMSFIDPKGTVYVFLKNESDIVKTFDIWINNKQSQLVDIPGHSLAVVQVKSK